MSYAGKFVGQNVGSWLGPVDSDPNALYAGLSGAGAASGTLTALGQLQAALFGGGELAADITYIEAAEAIDSGIGQGDGGKGSGVGRFRHTDVRSNLVIDLEGFGQLPPDPVPPARIAPKPARQPTKPAQPEIERSRTAELTGKVIAEAMAGAARDAAVQAATVAAQAKAEARAKTLALVIALAEADDDE